MQIRHYHYRLQLVDALEEVCAAASSGTTHNVLVIPVAMFACKPLTHCPQETPTELFGNEFNPVTDFSPFVMQLRCNALAYDSNNCLIQFGV